MKPYFLVVIFKSRWHAKGGGRDCRICLYICLSVCQCVFVNMFVHPQTPDQTKNARDLKFCNHAPLDHTSNVTLRAASLETLLCHVDCSISSIDLWSICLHNQNPREASSRLRIFLNSLVYLCMYLFICVTFPGQTKNDTDLKFGTPYLKTFFGKNPGDGH